MFSVPQDYCSTGAGLGVPSRNWGFRESLGILMVLLMQCLALFFSMKVWKSAAER